MSESYKIKLKRVSTKRYTVKLEKSYKSGLHKEGTRGSTGNL